MKRALATLAILTSLTACSGGDRSEEGFIGATSDLPGEARARLVVGDLVCGELNGTIEGSGQRDGDKLELAVSLAGDIYDTEQAILLVDAADEYLCP